MRPTDPRLLRQLRPARAALAGVLAAGVTSSLLVMLQAWVVAGLVLAVVHGSGMAGWALATVGTFTARAVVALGGDLASSSAAGTVSRELRRRLVSRLTTRPAPDSTGATSVLLTRGVAAVEPYVTRFLPALVLALVLPPLTIVLIAGQDLLSGVIVLATLPLLPLFAALVGLEARDRGGEQWRALASLSGHFLDVVRGLPTLVAHRRAEAQAPHIREVSERHRVATVRALRLAFLSSATMELVATLSVALVAVTVGLRLTSGALGLHTALVVLLLAPEAYWPLRRVGAEFHAAAEGMATFERVEELLADPPGPTGSDSAPGAGLLLSCPIVVRGLAVVRPGRTDEALPRMDARLPSPGLTVVTGPSGAGKTTLLDVLAGRVAASSGAASCGGCSPEDSRWRESVGYLPQRPVFVTGSVADNLRLASPGATDEQCWSVLRRVSLEERVASLPDGLHSPVGEDGLTLSAGERARLALARVLLGNRPWLLLDEPSAHLDEVTERAITDVVTSVARTHGVVVVSHRPGILAVADQVVALQPGPVSEPTPALAAVATPTTAPAGPTPGASPAAPSEPRPGSWGPTVLGALASASGVALTATAGWLIVRAAEHPAVLTMLVAIVGVRAFGLARPVLRYAERLQAHDLALRLLARRRVEVYRSLVPLTPAGLGRRRGEVLAAVAEDVDAVVDRTVRATIPARSFLLTALATTAVAALVLPSAAPVVAALTAAATASYALARGGAARTERAAVALRGRLSDQVVEAVQGAEELRTWQAGDRAAETVARTSGELSAARRTSVGLLAAGRTLVLVATGAAVAATALVVAPSVASAALAAPLAALLVLLPLALGEVASTMPEAGAAAAHSRAAEHRLRRIELTPPVVAPSTCGPLPEHREVRLDSVAARWPGATGTTTPVDLVLRAGERVALTGPSGSGKSTVAALMMRFLDPARGEVTMGGARLRDLDPVDVRGVVGLVDDDPHVFATTVAENVRLARPAADDAAVETALRRARLGPWLDGLPDGLDTHLGDGGLGLSGGERARLGLARSMLADHAVLVLDEPAAHLDHGTAELLARDVLASGEGRSVLWISHVPVGLDLVDRVVDLDDPATVPVPA